MQYVQRSCLFSRRVHILNAIRAHSTGKCFNLNILTEICRHSHVCLIELTAEHLKRRNASSRQDFNEFILFRSWNQNRENFNMNAMEKWMKNTYTNALWNWLTGWRNEKK